MPSTQQIIKDLRLQTELHLQKTIGEWQNLPARELSQQPAEGAWSAAQCLEHLNIYGRYYLPLFRKAVEKGRKNGKGGSADFHSGWLGAWFTKLIKPKQGGALKSKLKAASHAMPGNSDPHAVLAEFIDQQEELLQLLQAATSVDLNKNRIPISIAPVIRLKLGDTLQFLVAHIHRHMLQAERAVIASRSLTAAE